MNWIPINTALPDVSGYYLASFAIADQSPWVGVAYFYDADPRFESFTPYWAKGFIPARHDHVTHWAPLPGPAGAPEPAPSVEIDPVDLATLDSPEQCEEAARVLGLLSGYAKWRRRAMVARNAGDLALARTAERTCEQIANRLPEWARF